MSYQQAKGTSFNNLLENKMKIILYDDFISCVLASHFSVVVCVMKDNYKERSSQKSKIFYHNFQKIIPNVFTVVQGVEPFS